MLCDGLVGMYETRAVPLRDCTIIGVLVTSEAGLNAAAQMPEGHLVTIFPAESLICAKKMAACRIVHKVSWHSVTSETLDILQLSSLNFKEILESYFVCDCTRLYSGPKKDEFAWCCSSC